MLKTILYQHLAKVEGLSFREPVVLKKNTGGEAMML
jgi:hypothetical protein